MKLTPREPTPEIHNPWRESLENCISGDNYLRAQEYRDLIEELDDLYRLRAIHDAAPSGWQPIETAPDSGYLMVYEDGAYRLRLRHDGKWMDTAYAGIECAPWGDVAVGQDAQRILDMRGTPGTYKLVVRDGCCEKPTRWRPLPAPPSEKGE